MKATAITETVDVMSCPACGLIIRAVAAIEPNLGLPKWSNGYSVEIVAEPKIVRFNVSHNCSGPVEDEGVTP